MSYKSGLYNWERITKPRVYSRTQRVTSNDDIQDWLQKVEDASTKAAAETFGRKYTAPRRKAKESLKHAVEDAQIHDAAYSEAQDLLNQWVTEKVHLDNDLNEYSEDSWNIKTEADIKHEWDHLLSSDADLEIENFKISTSTGKKTSKSKRIQHDKDPYAVLYKDEGDLVNEVLDEMWQKDIFDDTFKNDLELDSHKNHDPTTKMKLRHLQVKENREKRLKTKEKKLRELQNKKDSQFKARQILLKEEKDKALLKKKEELEIQKEMNKIRKEMEIERKKQQEEIIRQKEEEEEFAKKSAEKYERQREEAIKIKQMTHYQTEERKKMLLSKMKEIETHRATENLKILQKYFSSWYNIVIERRLSMGKAKAMSDWKLLLRVFNAWKAYSRAKHMDKQAWTHEENLKQLHRKNNMADIYYRHRLLSKCITAWQLFVSQQQTQRYAEESNKKTKDKMAAFLEAAATGKLWTERSETPDSSVSHNARIRTSEHVEALFNQPVKSKGTFSLHSTARTEREEQNRKKVDTPTQAWQITKKHIKLLNKQMARKNKTCTCDTVSQGEGSADKPLCSFCSKQKSQQSNTNGKDTDREHKTSQKAWEKSPYVVNNFEHRHAAQQKILELQQKQIKEQQRLIEELQYLQKQQLLQQQLLQQEQAKVHLNQNDVTGTQTIQRTLTHLQQHIQNLQQQIIQGVSNNDGAILGDNSQNVMDIELRDIEDENDRHSDKLNNKVSNPPEMKLKLNLEQDTDAQRNDMSTTRTLATGKSTASKAVSDTSAATCRSSSTANHPRHTQFLKTMEERAEERARIKREREEKKRKEEEFKLMQLMAEEEKRKHEEAEEKQKRIEAHREKKKLEKQREVEKQQFNEKLKILTVKADSFRDIALLKYRGWRPWRKLIEILRNKEDNADEYYKRTLQRKCLCGWQETVNKELEEKYRMAQQFNVYITIKHAFSQWKQVKHASLIQEQKASRHYEYKIKIKLIRIWADFAAEEKVSMWHKERRAKEHNIERIKKKYFHLLRRFPLMRKEDEEKERRRAELRKKVSYLLPDFRASQKDD